jgi:KaiC/GvpD/RAD55 family RecA-like ATPase
MVKNELIKRSPLRILEKSIHGGVGNGNIGVIASRKGVGKTACLVHIATDNLFQGKHVIHVSFSSRTDHIISWYEDIFKEIAKKRELESAVEVHDELIKNRVIMNFNQEGVEPKRILSSLEAMINNGNFAAEIIVVDGYDFSKATTEGLGLVKDFAKRMGIEVWFSASLRSEEPLFNDQGIPRELEHVIAGIDVLVTLRYIEDYVHLDLAKDHEEVRSQDLHLKLDPKTLLIAEET